VQIINSGLPDMQADGVRFQLIRLSIYYINDQFAWILKLAERIAMSSGKLQS